MAFGGRAVSMQWCAIDGHGEPIIGANFSHNNHGAQPTKVGLRHATVLGKCRGQRGNGQCGDCLRNCSFHRSHLRYASPLYSNPAPFRLPRLTLFKSSGIYPPWTG